MIDVRKLRMLEALDRLGTIAAVGEELRLTAPGVSMQLSALERELGVSLTERSGRRLALTPSGKLLASHGRDVLDRLSLAELDIHALRNGEAGRYRVAAFPSAARTFVADAWRRLATEDGLTLALRTPEPEDALAGLVTGDVDLAVVHAYSNVPRSLPDGVAAEELAIEPIWLAIRADDPAAASTVDLAQLSERSWIAPTRGLTCFEMTDRACGLAGFRPRIVAETMDFAVQLELVAAGVGVALVPRFTVAQIPDGVELVRPSQPLHRDIQAVRRTSMRNDPGLDRITALFREAALTRLQEDVTASA